MPITVLCKQKKAALFPNLTQETQLHQITLGELREEAQKIFDYTLIPVKMIYAGVMMKNDNASLASYGINFRSKVVMIPTQPPEQQSAEETGSNKESPSLQSSFEAKVRTQIEDIVNKTVAESSQIATEFPAQVKLFLQQYPIPLSSQEYITEHRSLENIYFSAHETLIKGLLQLDAIMAGDPARPDLPASIKIRDQRKAAVHQLETLLDRLDHLWAQLKSTHPKP